jgi:hypothetical protein
MRSALQDQAQTAGGPWMTSCMKENMGARFLDAAALRKKCMRTAHRQRKSDYFCCMYGDAPKIRSRCSKIKVEK